MKACCARTCRCPRDRRRSMFAVKTASTGMKARAPVGATSVANRAGTQPRTDTEPTPSPSGEGRGAGLCMRPHPALRATFSQGEKGKRGRLEPPAVPVGAGSACDLAGIVRGQDRFHRHARTRSCRSDLGREPGLPRTDTEPTPSPSGEGRGAALVHAPSSGPAGHLLPGGEGKARPPGAPGGTCRSRLCLRPGGRRSHTG